MELNISSKHLFFYLMALYVFLQVKDSDNLVDVALTIIRNEISSVPIFKSLPDSSGMPLLNLATLQGILTCMILFYKTNDLLLD